MKIAAIDVGSNSIKLVVVDAAASDSFAVLAREKETVRLGHDTLLKGRLSPEAIGRAADCIKRFRAIAETRGAEESLRWRQHLSARRQTQLNSSVTSSERLALKSRSFRPSKRHA